MRKLAIFITTLIFAATSFFNANAQMSGLEIWHVDSNLAGTALIEDGIGFHFGGAETTHDDP